MGEHAKIDEDFFKSLKALEDKGETHKIGPQEMKLYRENEERLSKSPMQNDDMKLAAEAWDAYQKKKFDSLENLPDGTVGPRVQSGFEKFMMREFSYERESGEDTPKKKAKFSLAGGLAIAGGCGYAVSLMKVDPSISSSIWLQFVLIGVVAFFAFQLLAYSMGIRSKPAIFGGLCLAGSAILCGAGAILSVSAGDVTKQTTLEFGKMLSQPFFMVGLCLASVVVAFFAIFKIYMRCKH